MHFDRNINGNKDVKFLECDYLSCVTVCETHSMTSGGFMIVGRNNYFIDSK